MVGRVNLLSPLVVPPKLVLRALDDLHTMATVAVQVSGQIDRMLVLGERIDARAEAILALGERIDDRAEAILTLGGRIDGQAETIISMGDRLGDQGDQLIAHGLLIQDRAKEVSDRAADLIEALPLLERAIGLALPLEGAVERLGRVADRLPGGQRRTGRPPAS
jgi:hypothetical protein